MEPPSNQDWIVLNVNETTSCLVTTNNVIDLTC